MRRPLHYSLFATLCIMTGLFLLGPITKIHAATLSRVNIGGHDFYLERAQTPQELSRGLMYRRYLAPKHGMWFIFPQAHIQAFWMKNTLMPLDILYIHDNYVVDVVERAQPCTKDPCPVYQSRQPAEWVIELEGGSAAQYGLQWGDSVKVLPSSFQNVGKSKAR